MKKYTIISELVPMFEEKMQRLLRKFNKYGVCNYSKSDAYVCEDKQNPKYSYKVVDIEVEAAYKIEGYDFVASCEWLDEIGENLIKKPDDTVQVPEVYKTRRECDHCKTNRLRKHTVILKKDDEFIQVGTSCCRDYLGVDLGNYAAYLSFFSDLEEYEEEGMRSGLSRVSPMFELDYVLAQAIELTKHYGYISKNLSYERDCDSTSTRLWFLVSKTKDIKTGELLYPEYKITEETATKVEEIKQFYADHSEDNDFIGNIKSILKMTWIDGSHIGLVAAAVGTKLRLENERKERESKPVSNHVGEVGQRITFKTRATCIYSSESQYGWFYIYKMMLGNDELIWNTSKSIDCENDIEVTATIRNHSEYRGVKQTEITRARIKEGV